MYERLTEAIACMRETGDLGAIPGVLNLAGYHRQ